MITPEKINPGKLADYINNSEIISAMFSGALEMVSIIDPKSLKPLYSNKSVLNMLNYSEDQIVQLGVDWPKKITHPDDFHYLSVHITNYRTLLPGKRTRVVYRVKDSLGSWRMIESVSTALAADDDASVTKFIFGISKDITKKDDKELRNYDAELEHRCQNCNKLLAVEKLLHEEVETKCGRCGEFNNIKLNK